MPELALAGKSIVLIGGTTGLGLSAAKACAAAGARLVVVGRDPDSAAAARAELGEEAVVVAGDAADPATAEQAVAAAVGRFGALHGLYHVAGGSGRRAGDGPLHAISDEGWRYTLDLNLTSLFHSNRAAVRQFLAQADARGGGSSGEAGNAGSAGAVGTVGGTVLNMGSVLGFSPSPQFFATHAYAAAKAAVVGLTTAAAAYYAPHNIRFNVLTPALMETPMSRRAAGDPALLQFIRTKQPLDGGRVGRPTDLDAAVLFFLSDASKFVTGQVLAVDGGWGVSEGQIPPAPAGPTA